LAADERDWQFYFFVIFVALLPVFGL
jgi:hypothetical protein